ncbi:MAG: hypothetical protein IJM81_10405 [Prevotella sp.]|nr:hypothetical protein [Prevotella sp.]
MDKRFLQKVVEIFSNIVNLIFIGVRCDVEKRPPTHRRGITERPWGDDAGNQQFVGFV